MTFCAIQGRRQSRPTRSSWTEFHSLERAVRKGDGQTNPALCVMEPNTVHLKANSTPVLIFFSGSHQELQIPLGTPSVLPLHSPGIPRPRPGLAQPGPVTLPSRGVFPGLEQEGLPLPPRVHCFAKPRVLPSQHQFQRAGQTGRAAKRKKCARRKYSADLGSRFRFNNFIGGKRNKKRQLCRKAAKASTFDPCVCRNRVPRVGPKASTRQDSPGSSAAWLKENCHWL